VFSVTSKENFHIPNFPLHKMHFFHLKMFPEMNISPMKLKFVVTHTIRQTEIRISLGQLGYKHAFCQNVASTKKIVCPYKR
jgi:hypothetical protein